MPSPNAETGRKSNINVSPSRLIEEDLKVEKGLVVFAAPTNTTDIWVGFRGNITANDSDDRDGFPLAAGSSVTIHNRNAEEIYIRSTSGTQKAWWMLLGDKSKRNEVTGLLDPIPLQVPGLFWWGDFSDKNYMFTDAGGTIKVVNNNDLVAAVKDKSGISNKLFTQSSAGNRPTYNTNIQNGLSVLTTGNSKWLSAGDDVSFESNTMSVYFVVKQTGSDASSYNTILTIQGLVGNGNGVTFSYEGINKFKIDRAGAGGQMATSSVLSNPNDVAVFSSILNPDTGMFAYRNGTQIAQNLFTWTSMNYGGTKASHISGFQFWDGYIMEILYYKAPHTTEQQVAVEGYLTDKWGI